MKKISKFKTILGNPEPTETDLKTFIEGIIIGTDKIPVLAYRDARKTNQPNADILKRSLPAVKPSGLFSSTSDDSLIEYNGIVQLDYDDLTSEEFISAKDVLRGCDYTRAFFESATGGRLKVLIQTDADAETHSLAYIQVKNFFARLIDSPTDDKVKNIGRACFTSYDPEAFYNEDSKVFVIDRETIAKQKRTIPKVNYSSDNITPDEVWLRTEKQRNIVFGEGSRNSYVLEFGCSACRWGIDEHEALNYALQYSEQGFSENEIKKTIRSAYRTAQNEFNTISYHTERTAVPNFTSSDSVMTADNPRIPDEVFETLPEPLKEACSLFIGREREVFLTGSITAISGVIQDLYTEYHHDEPYPNLYCFIAAPSSSGKGAMSKVYHFLKDVEMPNKNQLPEILLDNLELKESVESDNVSNEVEPCVWVPANTSGAMLKLILAANNGGGVINSTENKTLEQILKSDFGSFGDDLLKGFQNEPIGYARKGDGKPEMIIISEPKFSVMVSGVREDLRWLLNSQSSGLTSRFMILSFNERNKFLGARAYRGRKSTKKALQELSTILAERLNRFSTPRRFDCTDADYELYDNVFNKLDNETRHDEEVNNLVWRHGLMVYKIAMVLTAIRGNYDTCSGDIICHSDDWQNALKLVVDVYYEHSKAEVQNFRSIRGWVKGDNIIKYLMKKDGLRKTFTTAYVLDKVKEEHIRVSDRTVSTHLSKAVQMGLIHKVKEGVYKLAA